MESSRRPKRTEHRTNRRGRTYPVTHREPRRNGIGRRKLGRADAEVSIIGIGGYHIGLSDVTEQEALRIVRTALDRGINFLDNCWDYNDGASEERMGKALADGYRKKAFPDDQARRPHRRRG
jgi:hypothetical protein